MIPTIAAAQLSPINIELAEYSDLFMTISAYIYTLALIFFAADIARSSVTIKRMEAQYAAEAGSSRAETMVGASAGSAARTAGAATSAGGTASGQNVRGQDIGGQATAGAGEGASGADARQPQRPHESGLVDEDMAYVGSPRPFANVAVAFMIVGTLAHLFAVVSRGIAGSRVPWANMYEFLTSGALLVSVVFLISLIRRDLRFLGAFATGLVVIMMAAATMGFPTPVAHVQPALQSYWIWIHVSLACLAMATFTLTFAMNILQLIQSRRERVFAEGPKNGYDRFISRWQFMRLVPPALSLENWAYRLNAIGFLFWTLGPLITGAIWARETWGRYWGWDVKEVWSFVIWVVYAGYLHARATRGWTGNRSAWLSIIGFACIIFNYAVVNVYFPGLHSYAGLPE